MCCQRESLQCIIPPHMMKTLVESKDRRVREAALRTFAASTRIRAQREVIGSVRAAFRGVSPGVLHRSIHNAHNQFSLPGELVLTEGQTPPGGAVKEAYDGLGATYRLFADVYHRNSIDGNGMRLVATVHYGDDYNNAFWNGQQMVFGDGDNIIFVSFTKSLDVIGHELTHGVVEHTCALEYRLQQGALNESFADVFGSLVKQYKNQEDAEAADWLIGSDILAPGINGHALRSMKDPGSAYDDPRLGKDPQPKHMNDFVVLPDDPFNDNGGVHINSGIPNHAFYLTARELGGYAWEDAGSIWYDAMLQLWPTAQFQDCANITTQIAGAKFGTGSSQQQAVRNAWDEVGLAVTAPHAKAKGKKTAPGGGSADGNGAALKKQLARIVDELSKAVHAMPT